MLFALGCFLAAGIVNAILVSLLLAPPERLGEAVAPPAPAKRSWAERQVILTRNLFKSSTEAPLEPLIPVENLERTRLPLTLLGTVAAENPQLAWAAIEDRDKRETLVVSVGDSVGSSARVQRIERRRVILLENGSPRELIVDADSETAGARPTPAPRARAAASTRAQRRDAAARRRSRERVPPTRPGVVEALRNPANILSQARILPKWENGQMLGIELNGIKGGSLLEEVGFVDGDLITEINGLSVDSPEQSALFVKELSEAEQIRATVERGGQRVTVEFERGE
ncbi:MAG: hypothetical protein OEY15_11390 [Myxococcales bacterium]|nr:hypothetical protein [Myxococcales bacterium]